MPEHFFQLIKESTISPSLSNYLKNRVHFTKLKLLFFEEFTIFHFFYFQINTSPFSNLTSFSTYLLLPSIYSFTSLSLPHSFLSSSPIIPSFVSSFLLGKFDSIIFLINPSPGKSNITIPSSNSYWKINLLISFAYAIGHVCQLTPFI